MKGYKFKLEALLKVRKLKEDQCKMEIGRLQVIIANLEKEIKTHHSSIDEAYDAQEQTLQSGTDGQEVKFYPYFVEGKRSHIKALEAEKERYKQLVNRKFQELKQLRAQVKVVEQFKEKDYTNYKKNVEKKMNEKIEEQVQNWRLILNKEVG